MLNGNVEECSFFFLFFFVLSRLLAYITKDFPAHGGSRGIKEALVIFLDLRFFSLSLSIIVSLSLFLLSMILHHLFGLMGTI
jgi:hypothetical protein